MKIAVKDPNQALEPSSGFSQKQYIIDLYECEKTKYILENRRKQLNHEITQLLMIPNFANSGYYREYNNQKKIYKEQVAHRHRTSFGEGTFTGIPAIVVLGGVAIAIIYDIYAIFSPKLKLFGTDQGLERSFSIFVDSLILAVVVFAVLILAKIICSVKDKVVYDNETRRYKTENPKNKAEVENFNANLIQQKKNEYNMYVSKTEAERAPVIEMYRAEKRQVKANIEKLENTLNELYSMRINGVLCLHPNYQGLIPVSIIYGYFDTGRCTQFQGHEGAYNLYEDEKMKGMIINRLEYVSNQLNNLNSTMSYVADALDDCNSRLMSLEDAGNDIAKRIGSLNKNVNSLNGNVSSRMASIETNTANAAYYSKVSARCDVFNTVYNLYDN